MAIGFILLFVFLACSTTTIGAATGAGIGWFVFLLGVAILIWWFIKKARADTARHHALEEAHRDDFNKAYLRWQEADKRWNHLYYCEVCDRQFVTNGQNQVMTEEEAIQYMYVYVD